MRFLEPFALPSGSNFDVKKFVRAVKTKAWMKRHLKHIGRYCDRMTTAGNDHAVTVKGMLTAGYGVNIGEQVFEQLSEADITSMRKLMIQVNC